jgi:hypothetical protein
MGLSEGTTFNLPVDVDGEGRVIYDDLCDLVKDKAVAAVDRKTGEGRGGERL